MISQGIDLQAVVQADMDQVRVEAQQIAQEVAAGRPEAEVHQVEAYLTQIPGVARQSLRRPKDPSGTTVPASLNLADPSQLASVLPRRAPRFRIGDVMPHAPQWRFVELLGSGGFGEVWLVQHTFLDQRRAIKFCLDPLGRDRLLRHEGEVVKRVTLMAKTKAKVKASQQGGSEASPRAAPQTDVRFKDLRALREMTNRLGPSRMRELLTLMAD
jgi:hypothetical protein